MVDRIKTEGKYELGMFEGERIYTDSEALFLHITILSLEGKHDIAARLVLNLKTLSVKQVKQND